jgi:hypothetical protein
MEKEEDFLTADERRLTQMKEGNEEFEALQIWRIWQIRIYKSYLRPSAV